MAKRIIACDLDGTLAEYDGWKGVGHIGAIIPSVANAILLAKKEGADIWIFTARVSDPKDAEEAGNAIVAYLNENGIPFDGLTAIKHKFFSEFWDDRAIQVIKNTGEFVLYSNSAAVDNHGLAMAGLNPNPVFLQGEELASDNQIGGDHYSRMVIQPIAYCELNGFDCLQQMVIKYVSRHKFKNGKQDIEKAIHTLQMIIDYQYSGDKMKLELIEKVKRSIHD